MNHLDLFSGIGGFALAAKWAGINTVAFCEIEPFAQKVLKKNFPSVPVFPDICKLKRSDINESIDIITGGFPCQPFSIAGRKKGTEDNRDLWPQMFRVIKEFKPTWVIGENVAHFVNMAFQRTKTDLESEGYEVQPFIIPACGVNAPHKRDRVWIVGYTEHNGSFTAEEQRGIDKAGNNNTERKKEAFQLEGTGVRENYEAMAYSDSNRRAKGNRANSGVNETGENTYREGKTNTNNIGRSSEALANTNSKGLQRQREKPIRVESKYQDISNPCWWNTEPNVGRVAHGIPNRVDRLRGLGNAIVPQVVYQIMKGINK